MIGFRRAWWRTPWMRWVFRELDDAHRALATRDHELHRARIAVACSAGLLEQRDSEYAALVERCRVAERERDEAVLQRDAVQATLLWIERDMGIKA